MFPPPGPGPSGCSKLGEGVSEVSSNSLGSGTGGHGEGGGCCHLGGQDLRVALLGQLSRVMFWELTWKQGPRAAHLRGTEPSGCCGCGCGGVGLGLPVLNCPQIHIGTGMPGSHVCGLGVIGPEGLPLSASWSSSISLHLVDFLLGGLSGHWGMP